MYRVEHIGLVVRDARRSEEFYRRVLGCAKIDQYQDQRVKLVFLQAGGQTIELVQYLDSQTQPRPAGAIDHIAFRVDDIETAAAAVKAAGADLIFDTPKTTMNGAKKIFFFAGPDGERLEFVQEAKA